MHIAQENCFTLKFGKKNFYFDKTSHCKYQQKKKKIKMKIEKF